MDLGRGDKGEDSVLLLLRCCAGEVLEVGI